VAADQEGGLVQRLKGPGFSTIPSARRQVTLGEEQLAARAEVWGSELRTAGITLDLAPVSDVVPPDQRNEPIATLRRGYGTNPADVATYVRAFVAGMSKAGVATSLKHFPGLGNVVENTDFTADVVDRVTTRGDPVLGPFAAGIAEGAPFLMVSLATYTQIDPDNPAVFSPTVIDGIVRGDLKFGGVVVSDDMGHATAVQSVPPADRALQFLRAGGDVVLTVDAAAGLAMWRTVLADPTLERRVDAAALRVLRAKERFGLLHCPL
jgi:beta-N-acetylhexosaminidase